MQIKFKKLHPDAQIPTRGTEEAAGLDLYALEDCEIWDQASIRTGIMCEIPKGYFGKVEARSGLSFKNGIETGAGVIDSDFRGEIGVKLYNSKMEVYVVKKGQRIAQMIIQPYLMCTPVEAEIDTDTERGANGFGSTGR
ncbi:dUTP diphosphatase [Paenibacillus sp. Soil724D2]|uniref:dUTP diphosphatase n=1 Tax=Paenibacillus sp. (strain Soil724D2) TaxID=1736392 RepID=UPI000713C817|nr:dUTP diphosphatase [Paenibacillus sp. Soil724D2]KRE33273.1 hypothetical protein ASG85_13410 [Paenibacillus sp. Soil724D2]